MSYSTGLHRELMPTITSGVALFMVIVLAFESRLNCVYFARSHRDFSSLFKFDSDWFVVVGRY